MLDALPADLAWERGNKRFCRLPFQLLLGKRSGLQPDTTQVGAVFRVPSNQRKLARQHFAGCTWNLAMLSELGTFSSTPQKRTVRCRFFRIFRMAAWIWARIFVSHVLKFVRLFSHGKLSLKAFRTKAQSAATSPRSVP